ncbi:MAG: carboxypeptidase-like regulatory domain-containing protein [Bacteroidales bacterium]
MKKILNICLLLLIAISGFSQKTISAFVKDATTLRPIKDVNVMIEGTSIGTTTNDSGFFSLTVPSNNSKLKISHISYKKQIYNIYNKENEVLLTPLINELKEFTINANHIKSITHKLPVYVIDYLLMDNKILLLVYNHKKINDTRLLLVDFEANILAEKKIEKAEELFIDCFNDIYFLNNKEAVRIEINPQEISLVDSVLRKDFNAYNKAIDFKINDNIFYHTFYYQNMILKLHCINLFDEEKEQRTILTIADSSKIDIFESEYDFFYYAKKAKSYGMSVTTVYKNLDILRNYQALDWIDIHGRFSPVTAVFFKIENYIYIFNSVENTIEIYDAEGRRKNKITSNYMADKNYTGKNIKEENGKRVYAVYKNKSTIQLKEIDLTTGLLKQQISIPDFPFIENIKITGNQIYFLYKKNLNEELKQLYTMQI